MFSAFFKRALLLIIVISGSAFSFSQQQFTIYNTINSPITGNTVRCIAVDTSNVVWIGTDNGLCRFDGSSWQTFTPSNSPLSDFYIRCITIDSANRVWVGTLSSGIFIYDGSSWQNINTSNSGISSNGIREIDFDPEGNLWVACAYGLSYLKDTVWTVWDFDSGFFTNNMSSIEFGPNKEKHIGTLNGGLHILDSLNNITFYTHYNSGLPDNTAYKVEFDASGNLWMATPSAGLLVHLTGDNWLWYSQANFLFPTNSTNYVSIDGNLKYITTYDKGLIVFDGTNSILYNNTNSLMPENYLHCVEIDKTGILWVGSDNSGLIRLDRSLATEEHSLVSAIDVFPTIVPHENGKLTISSKEQGLNYSVFSVDGNLVLKGNTSSGSVINIPESAAGVYLIKITGEKESRAFRFIIQ